MAAKKKGKPHPSTVLYGTGDGGMQHSYKFGTEAMETIISSLGEGMPLTTACGLAGITPRSYYHWIAKADEGDERYMEFARRARKARAEWERIKVHQIDAGGEHWQSKAWLLERVSPHSFGRRGFDKTLPPEELARGAIPLLIEALGEKGILGAISEELHRRAQHRALPQGNGEVMPKKEEKDG